MRNTLLWIPVGVVRPRINGYISPASLNPGMNVEFKNYLKTSIVAGGADIRTLKENMTKDMGEENI